LHPVKTEPIDIVGSAKPIERNFDPASTLIAGAEPNPRSTSVEEDASTLFSGWPLQVCLPRVKSAFRAFDLDA
jgi:hypothetical protein